MYCSVACYKQHKESPCEEVRKEKPIPTPQPLRFDNDDESDVVLDEVLAGLEKNSTLRPMLSNRHLRTLLDDIDTSTDPSGAVKAAMNIPIFEEFADECLKQCGVSNEET